MTASLAGLAHLLSAALLAASPSAPVDWSRDGRWLAYTLVESPEAPSLPRGWIFGGGSTGSFPAAPGPNASAQVSRIWATRAKSPESVLIEESPYPLSSPSWSVDGRSLIYGRFVPRDENGPVQVGRFEIVVRSGMERNRVVVVQPEVELDAEARAAIVHMRPAPSADGRRVAVPRLGSAAGLWVINVDEDRPHRAIESAGSPAWSPDGRRLAYLKSTHGPGGDPLVSVHLMNTSGGVDRPVSVDPTLTNSLLAWGLDGQSLLMISNPQRGPFRNSQLDLVRIPVEGGLGTRVSTLEAITPTVPRRIGGPASISGGGKAATIRVDLAMDAEQDQGVGLIETDGQEQVLKWGDLQTQNTFKRFHPLDVGLHIGAPALAPDGQVLAFRADDGAAGLVAIIELGTEEVTLVAPDAWARRRWLDRLAACASELLTTWVSNPAGDGVGVRPTILPILGELGGFHPRQFRLKRLAKFASASLAATAEGDDGGLAELRLFFAYLGQDFAAAERALDVVTADATVPSDRLRWLCLRAQILLSRGEAGRARGILDYIDRESRSPTLSLEETAGGYVLAPVPNPARAWTQHLESKIADGTLQRGANPLADFQGDDGREANLGGWDVDRMPNLPFAPNPGLAPFNPNGLNGGIPPAIRARKFELAPPPAPNPGLSPPGLLPRAVPPAPGSPPRLAPPPASAPVLRLEFE